MYIMGCNAPKKSFDSIEPNILLANTDSLMKAYPDNTELVSAIVDARLMLAGNDFAQYKKILIIDPNHSIAKYHIYMDEGKNHHKKGHKNGQWDAIQAFSKAAALIDSLGEPYYWIAKAYEKKDEMDFELALESYDMALKLYLPEKTRPIVISKRNDLIKRKETFDDFWK
tara:strand:+ start:112 stop:621 length:510 start_codon:yes stop_codon:yes gene_type:complete